MGDNDREHGSPGRDNGDRRVRSRVEDDAIDYRALFMESERQRIEAERQRIEAERQRIEAERRAQEAERQRIEERIEAERRAQEVERQRIEEREEVEALARGTYYTTISDLWDTGANGELNAKELEQLRRRSNLITECRHTSTVKGEGGITFIDPYELTLAGVDNDSLAAKPDPSRCSHKSTSAKKTIWPVSIFGNLSAGAFGDVAHLVPAASKDAATWWFLPPWLFGWPTGRTWTMEARMKAIHGSAPRTKEGQAQERKSRARHTGIKHLVTNKARIFGQAEFMDRNPCLLIVPILTLKEAVDWDGSGYEAIVVIDTAKDAKLPAVATGTGMATRTRSAEQEDPLATVVEIETARSLLTFLLRAIFTVTKNPPVGAPTVTENVSCVTDGISIIVPTSLKVDGNKTLRVRKVKFVGQNVKISGHPAPDPILLASKAAVVFSTRHEQRLAAGAEPRDDDWSELDELAVEQYLEWHEAAIRPQNWDDLARGLGQSDGFRV